MQHVDDVTSIIAGIRINNVNIKRVYATKCPGVQLAAQLTRKNIKKCLHICGNALEFLSKLEKEELHESSLLTLHYSFAIPYFIYCNHIRGNTY